MSEKVDAAVAVIGIGIGENVMRILRFVVLLLNALFHYGPPPQLRNKRSLSLSRAELAGLFEPRYIDVSFGGIAEIDGPTSRDRLRRD